MNYEEIWNDCLLEAKDEIIQNIKDTGKWASGKTANSITVNDGQINLPNYLYTLEVGRGPGKIHSDILIKWAVSKGISFNTPQELNRWAYFTAKKIREDGTEQYRNKEVLDIYTTPINDAVEKAMSLITENIENYEY